ncbi:MAG TPA: hypothetical protein VGF45_12290, partial [Polyangia bacterium]
MLVKPNGKLYTWGGNGYGQIGNGGTATQANPAQSTVTSVLQVAAGEQFSVALNAEGAIYTWGRNTHGQLGLGTVDTSVHATPAKTGFQLHVWRAIAAGRRHVLAIRFDGTLWGWGANADGQLGLGTDPSVLVNQASPVQIGSGTSWIAVSGGENFSLALRSDGKLFSAGANASGQLGRTGSTGTFAEVSGGHRWRSISAGAQHVVAIRDDGTLWSWGLNDEGQLGKGDFGSGTNATTPGQRGSLLWRQVSAGYKPSLGVSTGGDRHGWGQHTNREAGVWGTAARHNAPTLGLASDFAEYVVAGKQFSAAIRANGQLRMWGRNDDRQLGTGLTTTPVADPTAPETSPATSFANSTKPGALALGNGHVVALRSDGQIETWGNNNNRQLGGVETPSMTPTIRVTGQYWIAVAAGETQSLAISADGSLYGWGGNTVGEGGRGTNNANLADPEQIGTNYTWIKVGAHYATSFAIRADGTMWAFGDNITGQGGINATTHPMYNLTEVPRGTRRWAAVAVAAKNGFGITSSGELFSWGGNPEGQLGNSTDLTLKRWNPTLVTTATNWISVGTGSTGFAMGLQADGKLYGWGANGVKQLADASSAT